MARKSHDYVLEYILPAVVYWLCSYVGFWVDPGAVPGRVALCLTPILTLNNKMGQLRGVLPPINDGFRLMSFMLAALLLIICHLSEYCMLHFATRVVKAVKQRKGESVGAGGGSGGAAEVGLGDRDHRVVAVAPMGGSQEDREDITTRGIQMGIWHDYERIEFRWAMWAQVWLDFHARWFFLVVFVVISLVLLAG